MKQNLLKIKLASVAISAAMLSPSLQAQVGGDSNSDALALLLEQNQQLRAELQALRGMIEEQGFEVRKLQRDSLNRYTNIDDRLTALESAAVSAPAASSGASPATSAPGGLSPSSSLANRTPAAGGLNQTTPPATSTGSAGISGGPGSNAGNSAASNGIVGAGNGQVANGIAGGAATRGVGAGRGTLQPAVLSEQQLYQMAYDSVINSNFERSIAEFDQYLSIYPEGRFVTNAHYWKGQAFLYLDRFGESRDAYEIILNQYPDNAKVPDAMYGLALAYQGMGNLQRARQLLNDIKRRFPNTGAANLADTRLLSLD